MRLSLLFQAADGVSNKRLERGLAHGATMPTLKGATWGLLGYTEAIVPDHARQREGPPIGPITRRATKKLHTVQSLYANKCLSFPAFSMARRLLY